MHLACLVLLQRVCLEGVLRKEAFFQVPEYDLQSISPCFLAREGNSSTVHKLRLLSKSREHRRENSLLSCKDTSGQICEQIKWWSSIKARKTLHQEQLPESSCDNRDGTE